MTAMPPQQYHNRDRKGGDLSGVATSGLIAKLDYIGDLGFTAIWVTPPVENRPASTTTATILNAKGDSLRRRWEEFRRGVSPAGFECIA
jgi:glycosidase